MFAHTLMMNTTLRDDQGSSKAQRWQLASADSKELQDTFGQSRNSRDGLDGEVHRAVGSVVARARLERAPVEQVIFAIKTIWIDVAGPSPFNTGDEQLLARVITLCVNEYYR